jgi:hypothetical protein
MIHNETFLKDWYNRIYQIYGYDLELKKSGIRFNQKANEALNSPSPQTISKWKSLGISYLISSSPGISDLQFVAGNQKFSLYKIP